ncbi:ABC transporter substrate-binding protein [Paenibacillus sp. JCM 10914]|uniref:taurine ABC transporter substrate-binding protein n=1 Tax=Paenibacillus sp. JCM 10914 TaxID=1236974 RepID=UPI0003CC5E07|nr:aliphatic sulfonate ABC transporter substrate-binding protein [Paenibacillus sp. JCM 10914]GAE08745.1 taurine-binding periplasmic protein TauA [Paenibacillus sp. JCM 10914]
MNLKLVTFRPFRLATTFMLLAFVLTVAACSHPPGESQGQTKDASTTSDSQSNELPKEIRIGYQVSPNGELVAKALGLAEKKFPDVTVTWLKFDSGRDVNTAMASGSIDFGLVGTPPGASGIAQGLPNKIYYIHDVIGESEALVVQDHSGIQSLQDLKGKTIATTFGSTSHFSLLSALKQAGTDPASLKIIDMQAPDLIAAWQRGDIDGAYTWQPVQSKLLADNGVVVITSKEVAEKGALTGEFGVVHNDFAAKYPGVVRLYIEVLDEGTKYYRDHPQEAAEALSRELGLSTEETLKAMNEITVLDAAAQTNVQYLGTPDQPGQFAALLKQTADFLVEQQSIKSAPELGVFEAALLNNLYTE